MDGSSDSSLRAPPFSVFHRQGTDTKFLSAARVLPVLSRLVLLAAVALPLGLGGCSVVNGSGTQVSDDRTITAATRVVVCCGFDVSLVQSAKKDPSLRITTDDNLIDDVKVSVQGETLYLDWTDGWAIHHPSNGVRVELVLPELRAFSGSGGMRLSAGNISSNQLELALSGGSQANLAEVRTDDFRSSESGGSIANIDLLITSSARVESSGGSKLTALGVTNVLSADLSGGSDLLAEALVSGQATLVLSGASSARLNVTETLEVMASGGSQIWISGEPSVSSNLSGGSELHQN